MEWFKLDRSYNLNAARDSIASAGTSTAALGFGGANPPGTPRFGNTEVWNGASWIEEGDLNTVRSTSGDGTTTNALAVGGSLPPYTGVAEEWTSTSSTIKVLTD